MDADLHPLVEAAGRGEPPSWARMGEERREHAARVADLLDRWAVERGIRDGERARWVAAGWLHDALKDVPPADLRPLVPEERRGLPPQVLHGPAVAARLEADGVDDSELLDAVAWHSLGHPDLGRLGLALYCADFLEPGRTLREAWRRDLRARMPGEIEEVAREILRVRIEHLLERERPIRPETVRFWNRLAGGAPWAGG